MNAHDALDIAAVAAGPSAPRLFSGAGGVIVKAAQLSESNT
jgi:hypothetical protein